LEQVQEEVRLGHLTNAESMMREVVAARPGSARAHYVYAEILARNGNFGEAAAQARLARSADPQISFTDPEKFKAFEQLLQRERGASSGQGQQAQAPSRGAPPQTRFDGSAAGPERTSGSGVPGWVWVVGLGVVGVVAWRAAQRRRAAAALGGAGAYGPAGGPAGYGPQGPGGVAYGQPQPGQPGYAPYGPPASAGRSGMLGTGLAAAGGFAAGMLADRMFHDRPDQPGSGALDNLGPGAGGVGPFVDPAATELETRPVDFGTGGDDWGGGITSADSGSLDIGGGGGGDDWS